MTALDGRQVAVYQYTQKTKETMWSGKAFLDAKTSVPVKIEAATDATIEEGKTKLSNMKMVVLYKTRPDGSWVQDKSIMTMDIKLPLMPLVTFKGKVKTETELSDYRQ